jgi:hypothetical protein
MQRGAALGLLLLVGAGCTCRRSPAASQAPAGAPPPYGEAVHVATVRDVLCINEAVSVPARLVRNGSLGPSTIAAQLRDDAALVRGLGVGTVRVNSASYPFTSWLDWRRDRDAQERTDRYIAVLQEAGLEPVVVLGPWPGNQTANHTERYLPDDMQAYSAWVRRFVERYDGDGEDDAPGLQRPVRFWEVDNEPDLHNRVAPRGATREVDPATFETPEEYAQVLVATAAAIHQAQPDAVVLSAGTFHTAKSHGRRYLERVLAEPGAAQAVDVLSVHAYFEERSPELFLDAMDNAFALAGGRPVFVTETGVPSSKQGHDWVDEAYQARMLAFVVGESLGRGVERLCWHTLADPPPGPASRGGYASHSLHRTRGEPPHQVREPKLAGRVLERLLAELGAVPVGEIRPVELAGGRALTVGAAGWFLYEGEGIAPPWPGVVVDLLTGAESTAPERVDAPVLLRPAGGS